MLTCQWVGSHWIHRLGCSATYCQMTGIIKSTLTFQHSVNLREPSLLENFGDSIPQKHIFSFRAPKDEKLHSSGQYRVRRWSHWFTGPIHFNGEWTKCSNSGLQSHEALQCPALTSHLGNTDWLYILVFSITAQWDCTGKLLTGSLKVMLMRNDNKNYCFITYLHTHTCDMAMIYLLSMTSDANE